MRSRRPHPEHQAAVARRLAQLDAELAAARAIQPPPPAERPESPEVAGATVDPGAGAEEWWAAHTRVSSTPAPVRVAAMSAPLPGPEPMSPPAALPVPGRHAARRSRQWGVVPPTLRGRVTLAPGPLAVVAVLVAVALAVTCWWVLRGRPAESVGRLGAVPAGGLLAASASPTGIVQSTAPTTAAPGETVTVDVAGRVRRPGIAVLPTGSRVVDALEAAGGARRGVDLSSLNLARVLVDGEQVLVGQPAPAGVAASAAAGPGGPAGSGPLVNLNLAAQAELETLPDVGPVTAQSIIAWREQHGGFTAVEELLEVDGIGPATLEKLVPHVTV